MEAERTPTEQAILDLRRVVAEEAEKRHDQSDARGKLVVALAKHLAHINGGGTFAADHPVTPLPACVAGRAWDGLGGPFYAAWELFIEDAEQTVKLLCMEWELAAEVLKVRWL